MKKLMKRMHRGEGGFTLIELLIVIAILGIIAAIVVPNVSGFMTSGTINAANTEAQNVKTAAVGYLAENSSWPATSDDVAPFLEGGLANLKAKYNFDPANGGQILTVESVTWSNVQWNAGSQVWERAAAGG
jgi:prepilin-type N-terminal cleavage/methylation domain-containing protein